MDLIPRIQGILLKPKEEWDKIKGEKSTVVELFMPYVLILAAIPCIFRFIGIALIGGTRIPYIHRSIMGRSLLFAIFSYIGAIAAVYIVGMIINALASNFSSKQNQENAMKLAVYSFTPMWIAGVLYIIPILGVLAGLAGLYGLYILYLGFDAALMDTPKEKVVAYYVVSLLVAVVVSIVLNSIIWGIFMGGTLLRGF